MSQLVPENVNEYEVELSGKPWNTYDRKDGVEAREWYIHPIGGRHGVFVIETIDYQNKVITYVWRDGGVSQAQDDLDRVKRDGDEFLINRYEWELNFKSLEKPLYLAYSIIDGYKFHNRNGWLEQEIGGRWSIFADGEIIKFFEEK